MTFKQIMSDLEKKIYKPLYFLHGEEPYFIDVICDYIDHNVLSESEKAFNHNIFYGKDVNLLDVLEAARRFPMMANHQVIIVKEAQNIKDYKLLSSYLQSPMKSTILVFAYKYKKVDKRLKVFKDVDQVGILFESPKFYSNQIVPWIISYLEPKKKTIHPVAAALMSECLGSDLSRIANELEKLLVILPENETQISPEIVKDNIGIHRDFNVFELQKALGTRDAYKAYQIIDYFSHDTKNNPLVVIISQLYDYFTKLTIYHTLKDKSKNLVAAALGINIYFVDEYKNAANNYSLAKLTQIVSYLRDADVKSKGVDVATIEDDDIMKELIYKILH